VLPGMAKTSGGTVTDLVLDMTQIPSGIRYAVGSSGNVYRITTAGVWSNIGNIGENSGGGILYRSDMDVIYITGQTKVSRIKTVTTSPDIEVDWFKYGLSTSTTCYKTGGTNTIPCRLPSRRMPPICGHSLPTSNRCTALGVKPVVATGNWTLTLHDDANNSLGAVTVNAASLTVNQINYFVSAAQVRLLISANNYTSSSSGGRTYHFHLTSTVTTDTVQTTTASTLADCDMELWANALVSANNGSAPDLPSSPTLR
jgi:hypothetical protein